jgi:hypothetical protein
MLGRFNNQHIQKNILRMPDAVIKSVAEQIKLLSWAMVGISYWSRVTHLEYLP